ncbi:zinc finger protein OZF-like [Thalassophryne amazonica]|uniref:zinc finger protein OZF-like n=1 Tax=Thalassophryne amazonica TaxID=390379 RepID=UPI00147130AC|nr:zinc finger protein OZF-like [Thalassophryne amazonica]
MLQQLVIKEEMLPEQQELNLSVDQKDIKQEQEEVWTSNEGQQLHRLETEKTKLHFVPVKTENDDEIPQSSQVHQNQSDESPEVDPVASSSPVHRTLTAQAGEEDNGGPQSASCSRLPPDTNGRSSDFSEMDSSKWKQKKENSSGFNSVKKSSVSASHSRCNMKKKYKSSENVKSSGHMNYLKQGSEKTFSCSQCGKKFGHQSSLIRHTRIHTGQKPFGCSECGKRFVDTSSLIRHKKIHTGQKPFNCTECGKRFVDKSHMMTHMRIHTGRKPFSCSECGRRFGHKSRLITHMRNHTGQKPFSCSECGKQFGEKSCLVRHIRNHTGQKPFSCSECGKKFGDKSSLVRHLRIHTGQKPFGCSECGKKFGRKSTMIAHMRNHAGQKPFGCSECVVMGGVYKGQGLYQHELMTCCTGNSSFMRNKGNSHHEWGSSGYLRLSVTGRHTLI